MVADSSVRRSIPLVAHVTSGEPTHSTTAPKVTSSPASRMVTASPRESSGQHPGRRQDGDADHEIPKHQGELGEPCAHDDALQPPGTWTSDIGVPGGLC